MGQPVPAGGCQPTHNRIPTPLSYRQLRQTLRSHRIRMPIDHSRRPGRHEVTSPEPQNKYPAFASRHSQYTAHDARRHRSQRQSPQR
jgi:hypothetical protein